MKKSLRKKVKCIDIIAYKCSSGVTVYMQVAVCLSSPARAGMWLDSSSFIISTSYGATSRLIVSGVQILGLFVLFT